MELPLARNTDPETSHQAAEQISKSGKLGGLRFEARSLVVRYPGLTYTQLWQKHAADCRRRGEAPKFDHPVSLMRRLNEVAVKRGEYTDPQTRRPASQWWPK